MNDFLQHLIQTITSKIDVQAVLLQGSQKDKNQIDFWSDMDLTAVLKKGTDLNKEMFIEIVDSVGNMLGNETYSRSESVLYRTAIEYGPSIQLLDITLCTYNEWINQELENDAKIVYGEVDLEDKVIRTKSTKYSYNSYVDSINGTWFKYCIAIKKIARGDNLIGIHLLLDLVRDYLVLEMIERDIKHHTNIHRFGGNEQLPSSIKFNSIDESNKFSLLDYIDRLALEYDNKLLSKVKDYRSRYSEISNYNTKSKQELSINQQYGY